MKGATNKQDLLDAGNYISIHAPMKGATITLPPNALPYHFNPRTHEGCDEPSIIQYGLCFYISIHAPMKGATVCPAYLPITMSDFNPRTHEGCDVERTKNINYEHISIHAPMKGATFCCCERLKLACNFNPRTHEGCDASKSSHETGVPVISIHAPMKGAT